MRFPIRLLHTLARRAVSALLVFLVGLAGCPLPGPTLAPIPGLAAWREPGVVGVPGGLVNAAGGNLVLRRRDLAIDTPFGTRAIELLYDSALGGWRFDFEARWDGSELVDATGAVWSASGVAPGHAIPGTTWVVVDAATLRTKGGLVHRFDEGGRLAAVHWISADQPRLEYVWSPVAGTPQLAEIRQCTAPAQCTALFTIARDGAGRPTSITDRAGRSATYAWDAQGRLTAVRDGLDVERAWPGTRYEYSSSRVVAQTSSEGERVEYDWDVTGTKVTAARPIGEQDPIQRFFYLAKDGEGLYGTRLRDPMGHETLLRFDAQRRLVERLDTATADAWRLGWSGLRVASRVHPGGLVWTFVYTDDDVTLETQPSGNVVTRSYAVTGENRSRPHERALAEVSDSLGPIERRGYDAQGRLVSVENGEGEATLFTWGADGLLASVTTPAGAQTTFAGYGAHGHATQLGVGGLTVTRAFDAVGNRTQGPDDSGRPEIPGVVSRSFDADRNPSVWTVAASDGFGIAGATQTVSIEWRSDHKPTAIRRPGGGDHELDYDALGRLVARRERVSGAFETTWFAYDAAGRRVVEALPNGMRRETDYDAAGRPVELRGLRSGALESRARLGWSEGRVVSLDDTAWAGVESYQYDSAGRLASVRFPGGESLGLEYDLRSRETRETYWMSTSSLLREIGFGWDRANRQVEVRDGGTPVVTRSYTSGELGEVAYGNGLVRSLAYDANTAQLASATLRDAAGAVLEQTSVTSEPLYGLGLRLTATTITSGPAAGESAESYWLGPFEDPSVPASAAGKRLWLAEAAGSDPSAPQRFAWDALANPSDVGDDHFVWNAERNRLAEATVAGETLAYAYDEAGFATSRAGVPLGWNAYGRLASYGTGVTLAWDALGRLVSSSVEGVASRMRFGSRVQGDAAGLPRTLDLGEVAIGLGSGDRLYRHLDFRGNVKLVSNQSGQVITHYRYSAHGVDAVIGDTADSVRFAGRPAVGPLALLGARVYDPAVGRFLSPDPILEPLNQHAYGHGNPLWFQDPDGLQLTALEVAIAYLLGLSVALTTKGAVGILTTELLVVVGVELMAIGVALAVVAALVAELARQYNIPTPPHPTPPSVPPGTPPTVPPDGPAPPTAPPTFGGPGSASCSPTALTAVPGAGWWLAALVPIQLALGALVLARRRRAPRRPAR
jgi:RHS repeat-associated protein